MSAKIQPFDSAKISRRQSSEKFATDTTKSPRSPRTKGKLSRQSSFDDTKPISRQNSLQGSRRKLIVSDEDADITDHSSSSARGMSSARGHSSKNKSTSRKHSKPGKKRVVFRTPLIDPRPEPTMADSSGTFGNDSSLNEEEFQNLQNVGDDSYSTTPRRMRKRRHSGAWRRYVPFGQYIPTLPSIFPLW